MSILMTRPGDAITAGTQLLASSYTGWLRDAHDGVYAALKRGIDLIVSTSALLILAPLLIATAIAVKCESPGPVLFSQTRIGRRGRPFKCWKFRSMYTDAEARKAELQRQNEMEGGTTFKMKRDPRITRIGRFIRKASIDELPQLWNVWVGEMSLVGPRPPVPAEVAQYTAMDRLRLSVKPGITCIWQVSGRSDIPFEQQVQLDIRYIYERSLWLDIRLLVATVPAVLLARGAY
ncbi:sugar transferase [Congregibacter litoralis]|uniref:Exopolysaccharide biosynthesis polyprenyl glycosylphosphotransferase n=1 Tax=Congregibacter litoralis KT71 TaxID=314285 RepID=A4AB93_9GAMM|nr:exopolysaccharide biosynthesis polyprenyl glycosylphosphotransferase [Congregibacter litoralis]EAQ96647.1 exopolysaccharide biosynthesis polyprenyl glycosylphosphotransferase [Congregibacter litoralis KT71]